LDGVLKAPVGRLKPGEVSEPISAARGGYLVKVLAKRRAATSTEAEKQEVERMVFQRKLQENLQTFLSQLRSEAYIKIMT
jgi:peptidyl-prolyl cis-trans isomerase SurA